MLFPLKRISDRSFPSVTLSKDNRVGLGQRGHRDNDKSFLDHLRTGFVKPEYSITTRSIGRKNAYRCLDAKVVRETSLSVRMVYPNGPPSRQMPAELLGSMDRLAAGCDGWGACGVSSRKVLLPHCWSLLLLSDLIDRSGIRSASITGMFNLRVGVRQNWCIPK